MKDFVSKVTSTDPILNGKPHFLCSENVKSPKVGYKDARMLFDVSLVSLNVFLVAIYLFNVAHCATVFLLALDKLMPARLQIV